MNTVLRNRNSSINIGFCQINNESFSDICIRGVVSKASGLQCKRTPSLPDGTPGIARRKPGRQCAGKWSPFRKNSAGNYGTRLLSMKHNKVIYCYINQILL